ncbi:group II intron reverse transcriptase/maturase [Spirochaetia bacterium]|nr:group II intron reverse transcriptase/maturase [Spirochaetia bacterium]
MDTQRFWDTVLTKQYRIAEAARKYLEAGLTNLAHHIDESWMFCAYEWVNKNGAVGIDGVDAEEYAQGLWPKLERLVEQLKSGTYRAPAVKRVYIPKAGSETDKRPIGIPTFEDKILQRAIEMVLEPIYEQEFYDFSYGFRTGKSAHQALERIWKESMNIGGGYIIDMDISKYFDSIPHGQLREIIGQRVSDGVIQRIIGKWLNAGVMDGGNLQYPGKGTPQGGVISPILSNIYLHEVLDKWFVETVKPCLKGRAYIVRYADDAIIGCELEEDANRIMKVLPLRFAKYGLTIHPEKTKLVDFSKPRGDDRKGKGNFKFLGFKHFWQKSQKGNWVVYRKTDSKRLARAITAISQWCRKFRNVPQKEQHDKLAVKLKGHYAYYGITGNYKGIEQFFDKVRVVWLNWLNRRSDRKSFTWERFTEYLKNFPLPAPKIVHSYC